MFAKPSAPVFQIDGHRLTLFTKPSDALRTALRLHYECRSKGWSLASGIHMFNVQTSASRAELSGNLELCLCESLARQAQPGQILMTRAAFDSARPILRGLEIGSLESLSWLNHGRFLHQPTSQWVEICEAGEASFLSSSKVQSGGEFRAPDVFEEDVGSWRPANDQKVPGTDWKLTRRLGEGGFGEVWQAAKEGEESVFKFCFKPDRVRSLRREASLFSLLKRELGQSPRIVTLRGFEFGHPPYYIQMEYIEGLDLKTWSASQGGPGAPSVNDRLEIVAQIAEALEAAHRCGVLHRDVKPANILVHSGPPGMRVKLADFGIGQILAQEGRNVPGFTQTMITPQAKFQSGTFLYMAPELIEGQAASPQSDMFSLGLVFYQLLAGDFDQTPSVDWESDIEDSLLRGVLTKCLAGDPERRFSSAGELAEVLRSLEPRIGEHRRLRTKTLRKSRMMVTAGVALLVWMVGHLGVRDFFEHWEDDLFRDNRLLKLGISPRLPRTPDHLLDLSPYYNMGLNKSLKSDGSLPGNNMAQLTAGIHRIGDVDYDIRGIVQLAWRGPVQRGWEQYESRPWPSQILVPVDTFASKIHFLHAARYAQNTQASETPFAAYTMDLADGTRVNQPVRVGYDLWDWHIDSVRTNMTAPKAVWTGQNRVSNLSSNRVIALFQTTWINPKPQVKVAAIRCNSMTPGPLLFVVGITLEK